MYILYIPYDLYILYLLHDLYITYILYCTVTYRTAYKKGSMARVT